MRWLQSALDPGGAGGADVARLWWVMFTLGAVVFVAVAVALVMAFRRGRGHAPTPPGPLDDFAVLMHLDRQVEMRAVRMVALAAAATITILLVTFGFSLFTSRAAAALAVSGADEIEVTGGQWWWEVRYLDPSPQRVLRTANEIHLPAGRPVRLRLRSRDVIHSFWVPSLHGKMDLIPGRENDLWIRADRPGTYRGQCAEFCGVQHAKMIITVVVHPPEEYDAWREAMLQPSRPPVDSLAREGERAFERLACVTCHSVRGTNARAQAGPDLTHFARRLTIAAGAFENTTANLGAWLADPQTLKPGNHMPRVVLTPQEVQALVAYLEQLQ